MCIYFRKNIGNSMWRRKWLQTMMMQPNRYLVDACSVAFMLVFGETRDLLHSTSGSLMISSQSILYIILLAPLLYGSMKHCFGSTSCE